MKPDDLQSRLDLMRDEGIFFYRDSSDWPDHTAKHYSETKDLGAKQFEHWVQDSDDTKPRVYDTARRAARLTALAERCAEERKNEAGWRADLEPEVFLRFAVEVAWWALKSKPSDQGLSSK